MLVRLAVALPLALVACVSEVGVRELPPVCPPPASYPATVFVDGAGDVNGDGFDDLLQATNDPNDPAGRGTVCVLAGSASGDLTLLQVLEGEPGDRIGERARGVGDLDGDGFADVAHVLERGPDHPSEARLHLGGREGLGPVAWSTPLEGYTASVLGVGDLNGDGFDELLAMDGRGAAVFPGGPEGPATRSTWTLAQDQLETGDVAWGDLNADGFVDLVFVDGSARRGSNTSVWSNGAVRVWLGSTSGLSAEPDQVLYGAATHDGFGARCTPVGDVDGDGFDDLVLGGLRSGSEGGTLHLFRGGDDGLSWERSEAVPGVLGGGRPDEQTTLAGVGDTDGDGHADVLLTATAPTGDVVQLWNGTRAGELRGPTWTQAWESTRGMLVRPAGDLNGDGFADVVYGDHWVFGRADVFVAFGPLLDDPPPFNPYEVEDL